MTDEELVQDAHAFAKEIAAKIATEKFVLLDEPDSSGVAWTAAMIIELARTMAIGTMASYDRPNPDIYKTFMRQIAMQATLYSAHPGMVQDAIDRARAIALKIDSTPAAKQ